MKKLLSILLLTIPFFVFGQSMNISYEVRYGREFSINTHTGNFQYSMISGDKIDYNDKYDDRHKSGIVGYIKAVGGLKVYYNEKYDDGPLGSIKNSSGSVN